MLIIMLVIVLISLSDFKVEQKQVTGKEQTESSSAAKTPCNHVPAVCKTAPPINLPENNVDAKTEAKNAPLANFIPYPPTTKQVEPQPILITVLPAVKSVDENELQQQLSKKIDEFGLKDSIEIKVKQGYAELEIQEEVLFKSSEAYLTVDGKLLLQRLSPLLKQAVGLILIEGHTDNRPIHTPQFPSNWELGSSRATSVLHFLASQQLDSNRLRAITYADTMPIADNSTPEGREKNRRVNILIKISD
ncbi:MAG: OmpA family protein [Methylobacter sp.]|nr:OmpA family protein [Methylobacter sp.]